jgi:hypothetical protein
MASDFRLKEQLPQLTNRIVDTYRHAGTINHLGHCPLPRYEEVVAALDDLKEILYPGYRRREGLHFGNITYYVGELIDSLHDRLTTQIARALRHEDRGDVRRILHGPGSGLRGQGTGDGRGVPRIAFPDSEKFWPRMSSRPMPEIPPAGIWTRSSSATPDSMP